MVEGAQPDRALPILDELRAPMIEAGAQDHFLKLLSTTCERLPGRTEPLEALADFCRTTSDPFRLNAALGQLSDAYAAQGNFPRAEELLVELVDRNKNDERLVDRLNQLRARTGGAPVAGGTSPESAAASSESLTGLRESAVEEQNKLVPPPPPAIAEEALDEETQRYIAQALTDVDLFSSYGLTQKATHLLENVLQRAPRHTPTLERLLDLHLGAGNDRRTAELASQLEQIHRERNDTINADRFAELRARFSKVAGLTEKDMPAAPTVAAPEPVTSSSGAVPAQASAAAPVEPPAFEIAPEPVPVAKTPAPQAAPIEFEIPLAGVEPEAPSAQAPTAIAPEEVAAPVVQDAAQEAAPAPIATEELDLSDEWEAIAAEAAGTESPAAEEVPLASVEPLDPVVEPEPAAIEAAQASDTNAALEAVFDVSALADEEPDPAARPEPFHIEANTPQGDMTAHAPEIETPAEAAAETEIELIEAAEAESPAEAIPESVLEIEDEPIAAETAATSASPGAEFELELTPETTSAREHAGAATTEDFISELVAELDDLEAPAAEHVQEPAIAASS